MSAGSKSPRPESDSSQQSNARDSDERETLGATGSMGLSGCGGDEALGVESRSEFYFQEEGPCGQMGEGLQQFGQRASNFVEEGKQRMQETRSHLEEQIRSQPWKSMLVTAGISFLVGAIWSRR